MTTYVQLRSITREAHPRVKRIALQEVPRQGEIIDLGEGDKEELWEVMRVVHHTELEPGGYARYRGSDFAAVCFHEVVLLVRPVILQLGYDRGEEA